MRWFGRDACTSGALPCSHDAQTKTPCMQGTEEHFFESDSLAFGPRPRPFAFFAPWRIGCRLVQVCGPGLRAPDLLVVRPARSDEKGPALALWLNSAHTRWHEHGRRYFHEVNGTGLRTLHGCSSCPSAFSERERANPRVTGGHKRDCCGARPCIYICYCFIFPCGVWILHS